MVLVAVMLMSVLCVSASAEEATELTSVQKSELLLRKADVNGDNTYSTDDAIMLLKAAAGTVPDAEGYDVNSDGVTSVEDAIAVLKQATGVKNLLTDAQAVELVNAKLNNVKIEKPGFDCVSTAQCTSMKVTQKLTAEGDAFTAAIFNAALKGMNYTDLEYDKYVDKMVEQLESSKNTEGITAAEIASINKQIESMKKSGETYNDVETAEKTVAAGNISGHKNYFPIAGNETTACALAVSDIESISYTLNNGEITFNVVMKATSYNNSDYPKNSAGLAGLPYGKVFNLPFLRGETGSTLTKAEYKNGKVTIVIDKNSAEIKKASYSYDYFSDVKAPTQTMTESGVTIKAEMSTKMSARITENFEF